MTAQEAKEKTKESLNALNEKKKVFFDKELERLKNEVDDSILHAISLGNYALNENFLLESYKLDNSEYSQWTVGDCEKFAAGIAKYLKENGYTFEVKPGRINCINVFVSWSK